MIELLYFFTVWMRRIKCVGARCRAKIVRYLAISRGISRYLAPSDRFHVRLTVYPPKDRIRAGFSPAISLPAPRVRFLETLRSLPYK
jgi:hypothetical protein